LWNSLIQSRNSATMLYPWKYKQITCVLLLVLSRCRDMSKLPVISGEKAVKCFEMLGYVVGLCQINTPIVIESHKALNPALYRIKRLKGNLFQNLFVLSLNLRNPRIYITKRSITKCLVSVLQPKPFHPRYQDPLQQLLACFRFRAPLRRVSMESS